MKINWIIAIFLSIGCGSTSQLVQDIPVDRNSFQDCLDLFQNEKWSETLKCLEEIPQSGRDQAYYDLKGSAMMKDQDAGGAMEAFRTAIDLDTSGQNLYLYFKWGESLWYQNRFREAGQAMMSYRSSVENPRPDIVRQTEYYIRSYQLADSLFRHQRDFVPVPLPPAINSEVDELGLSMSYDRRQMILTRRTSQEDLYESHQSDGTWEVATPIRTLNTSDNEGAAALSGDGRRLVYTACNRPENVGSCDLYLSVHSDTGWMQPQLLPGVNSRNWDSQPTLSTDGRVIIFSSERPGGYGGRDLWLSVRTDDGWIDPVNLGPNINTPGHEENPFLHSDEYTLYFTSDYRPGFGGRDLFMTHRLTGNEWSEAQNLGYPVNSPQHEEGIFIESSGRTGYFASARGGRFDLYRFEVDPAIRPHSALLYQMIVVDSLSRRVVPGAGINIYDWTGGQLVRSVTSDREGYAAFLMRGGRKYGITVSKKDYVVHSFSRTIDNEIDQDLTDTIELAVFREKNKLVLENVQFATGEARLLEGSTAELDQLARYLVENADTWIVLTGHTDNVGSEEDNMKLSTLRAQAVRDYLSGRGVAAERMEAIGKGETEPITSNENEEGRQKNRRTEITINQ